MAHYILELAWHLKRPRKGLAFGKLNIFWIILGLFFFIFVFSTVNKHYVNEQLLSMTGLEPRTSDIRFANWTTTTAPN